MAGKCSQLDWSAVDWPDREEALKMNSCTEKKTYLEMKLREAMSLKNETEILRMKLDEKERKFQQAQDGVIVPGWVFFIITGSMGIGCMGLLLIIGIIVLYCWWRKRNGTESAAGRSSGLEPGSAACNRVRSITINPDPVQEWKSSQITQRGGLADDDSNDLFFDEGCSKTIQDRIAALKLQLSHASK